jgi:hypothetical protein
MPVVMKIAIPANAGPIEFQALNVELAGYLFKIVR